MKMRHMFREDRTHRLHLPLSLVPRVVVYFSGFFLSGQQDTGSTSDSTWIPTPDLTDDVSSYFVLNGHWQCLLALLFDSYGYPRPLFVPGLQEAARMNNGHS